MDKYNLNNEEYNQHLEGLLLANLPIDFYGFNMSQLTVREILLMGEHEYSKLIRPFGINKNIVNDEKIKQSNLKTLDILYAMNDNNFENCIKLIKLLFGLDDDEITIIMLSTPEIIVRKDGNSLFINSDRFEQLKYIILKMFNAREITEEDINKDNKQLKFKDDETKSSWDAFMKRRKSNKDNKKKDNQVRLYNVYNFMSNCNGIDYKSCLELTIYQIFNSYNIKHIKDNVDYTMKIATNGMCSAEGLDLSPLSVRIVK